ncbi:MAG: hypothetical protein F6K42_12775 [Leptolyngbya sp. SIO1D8]|nr:hypothetical protein [Leptolyngbya sp. SIO1D8]
MARHSHYSWNATALRTWLETERATRKNTLKLSHQLNVPMPILVNWLTPQSSLFVNITLEQLQVISNYRGWRLDQTIRWLSICPAHLEELRADSEKAPC